MTQKARFYWWARLDSNQGPDRYEKSCPCRNNRKQAQGDDFISAIRACIYVLFRFNRFNEPRSTPYFRAPHLLRFAAIALIAGSLAACSTTGAIPRDADGKIVRPYVSKAPSGWSLMMRAAALAALARISSISNPPFVKWLANHYVWCREEAVNFLSPQWRRGQRSKQRIMVYSPQQIANFFLDKAEEDGIPVSPLKLLKLAYIAYGWNIALRGEKLFEEPIEAWEHGPVIPSLYHEFKHYRNAPISGRSEDIDLDTWETVVPRIPQDDEDTNLVLNKVWSSYRRFKAWDLRQKTHEPDGPWDKVYQPDVMGIELRDDDIKAHYQQKIASYLDAAND